MTDCGSCPIRHRAVCAYCDRDELARLDSMKSYRSFEAGQTIVWAGDPFEFVASLVSGVATLTRAMEDGRTQMVGMLLPSDFLGRPGRQTATLTVTAATDVLLCRFRRRQFESMMAETPHVESRLLEMTLDELDAARDWMLVLGRKTARERIASLLIRLARRNASLLLRDVGRSVRFELPIKRDEMADFLGLTIETVSRQMSALRRDGLIDLEGRRGITVPDLEALAAVSGERDSAGVDTDTPAGAGFGIDRLAS